MSLPRVALRISFVFIFLIFGFAIYYFQWFNQKTIKIGAIISLTGTGSHLVDMKDAMNLAVEEVNNHGGINGMNLELIIKDNQTNPDIGKKAFIQLEQQHKPLFYISALSSISTAIAPLANENQVVLFGLVVNSPQFTQLNQWVYRYYSSIQYEITPIISFIQQFSIKKLGILYLKDEYGNSMYHLFKQELSKANDPFIMDASFTTELTHFTEQIQSLFSMQAIYIVGFVQHIKIAICQLKALKYKGYIFSTSGIANLVKTTPEVDGVYFAAPIIYNSVYHFAKEIASKFENRFNKPITHQAASGYDLIKLLAGLLENHDLSRKTIKQLIDKGFYYPGVFGDIHLEPGGKELIFPLFPAKVDNGNITYFW